MVSIQIYKQTKEGLVLGFLCAMISVLPKSERFLPVKNKYAAHLIECEQWIGRRETKMKVCQMKDAASFSI